MGERFHAVKDATLQQLKAQHRNPKAGSNLGPTLSFKEVVAKFELKPGKLKSALRFDETAPKPRSAFNRSTNSNVYYDRAEILKYVKANLEKLK